MKSSISPGETSILSTATATTLSGAIAYADAMQEENGAWSRLQGEFPAESEPTSWAVRVLSGRDGEAERVKTGVAFMLNDQRRDGSWNGNSAHTAFAVLALLEARTGEEAVKRAVTYLQRAQEAEGGFTRLAGEGQPLTVYTANVLFALKAAGFVKGASVVEKALPWLRSCQNEDGGFGMTKGADSTALATAWTVRALRAFDGEPVSPPVTKASEWLLRVQHASGGFSMTVSDMEDPEVTSLAICALRGLPGMEKVLERAVTYLNGAQHDDGAFTSSMPMQFNNVAKKNTQTTLFVIWALSEMI